MDVENNETPEFCKNCGKCCTTYPGGWLPSEVSIERQQALLESHLAVWDYYHRFAPDNEEFPKDVYYLRPANTREHRNENLLSDTWPDSPCIFLGPNGCKLSWEERPFECKDLKATAPATCSGTVDMEGMLSKDWISRKWEAAERGPYDDT